MPNSWDCGPYGSFIPRFFKESPYCSPEWIYQFTFPPTMQNSSFFSTSSPAFIVCRFFDDSSSAWWHGEPKPGALWQARGVGKEVGEWFKKEGSYLHVCLIHVDVWQKPTQYCKTIILQLKRYKFIFKITS